MASNYVLLPVTPAVGATFLIYAFLILVTINFTRFEVNFERNFTN